MAKIKHCGVEAVDAKLKELKSLYPLGEVERYVIYRNKIGYHYDADMPEYLARFGQEDSSHFYALLKNFVLFSREWARLTKKVIQDVAAVT